MKSRIVRIFALALILSSFAWITTRAHAKGGGNGGPKGGPDDSLTHVCLENAAQDPDFSPQLIEHCGYSGSEAGCLYHALKRGDGVDFAIYACTELRLQ